MTAKRYCAVSGALFILVALAHLARIAYDLPVTIGGYALPMVVSWVAFFVPALLAAWALRLAAGPASG